RLIPYASPPPPAPHPLPTRRSSDLFCAATAPRADTRPKSSPRSTSTITGSWSASGSADDQVKYSLRFPLNRTSTIGVNSLLVQRSEEHTSELQSRGHLVCRLLLEKK